MIDDIYNEAVLALAAGISRLGLLPSPDAQAQARSPLCGSVVTVSLIMDDDGVVTDFGHEVSACALGQASSSVMARHIIGSAADELRRLRDIMRAMLKKGGPPPAGKWADLGALEPVRRLPERHASVLLTFDAVCSALDKACKADGPLRRQAASS